MTPNTLLASWPSWAGRAGFLWSLLYAAGAALAALTGPAFGYTLLAKGTGTAAETTAAVLYGAGGCPGFRRSRSAGRGRARSPPSAPSWPRSACWPGRV
ncbi:hypothetical protein ABT154_13950 [Streptomyces sp. NPDC001728]|uniref:hypothetical protein n=1 Tax=Streptomyces sp. NPDC001728 TaxID=3154396 RepID=UPI00331E2BDD